MKKITFLLIEDDEDMISLLTSFLRSEWPESSILVGTEQESFTSVSSNHVNLIFLDINLPDFNGFDLGHQLKTFSKNKNVPIIYISSNAAYKFEEGEIYQENVTFLSKPLAKSVVLQSVKKLLE